MLSLLLCILICLVSTLHSLPLDKRDLDSNGNPIRRSSAIQFAPLESRNSSRQDEDELGIDLSDLRLDQGTRVINTAHPEDQDFSDTELDRLVYSIEGGHPDRTRWTEFACSGPIIMTLERGMSFNTYHSFSHCVMKGGTCCSRDSFGQRGVMAYPSERYCSYCFTDMRVVQVRRDSDRLFEFDEEMDGRGFSDDGEIIGRK